ncbi:MAG: Zn-ribbon domain-containing OB-fold protein [Dehalococcoidia bacterium]
MTAQPGKPLPSPSAVSQPFWDGLAVGELRVQKCDACGRYVFYPRPFCPHCLSDSLTWTPLSGRGRVYTYTIVRRAMNPAFTADVPYVFAIVELEEGPRLPTNVINCPPDAVRVEMPVKAVYDKVTAGIALLKFEPA